MGFVLFERRELTTPRNPLFKRSVFAAQPEHNTNTPHFDRVFGKKIPVPSSPCLYEYDHDHRTPASARSSRRRRHLLVLYDGVGRVRGWHDEEEVSLPTMFMVLGYLKVVEIHILLLAVTGQYVLRGNSMGFRPAFRQQRFLQKPQQQ